MLARGAKAGIAQVEADLGPIEVVVANAGITRDAPFHKMTPEQWKEVIDTNLTGVFNTIHPIWPGMRERKFGRVIVISSINGQKGQFAQVNYAATKAGDLGIVKSLAQEGARAGDRGPPGQQQPVLCIIIYHQNALALFQGKVG